MIKIFKNIRIILLRENSFTRYLFYAMGEIILVVIGILIALQVNNWNEQQKKDREARKILIQIQDELLNSVQGLKYQRSVYKGMDSLADIILTDTLKESDFLEISNRALTKVSFAFNPFRIQKEGFKSYIDKADQFPEKYASLEPVIKSHYLDYEWYYDEYQNILRTLIYRQMDFARNKPWYREVYSQGPISQEYVKYLANDPRFKNEVWEFRNYIYWNSSVGLAIQKSAVDLYKELAALTNNPENLPEEIRNFYEPKSKEYMDNLVGTYKNSSDNFKPLLTVSFSKDSLKIDGSPAYFLNNDEILYFPNNKELGEIYRFDPKTKTLVSSTLYDQSEKLKKVDDKAF